MTARLLRRWLHYRRIVFEKGMGVCGQCGYTIAPRSRMICPECGCDLRRVGLVTAKRKTLPKMGWGPIYALAILASLWVSIWYADPLGRLVPFGWHYNITSWIDDGWP